MTRRYGLAGIVALTMLAGAYGASAGAMSARAAAVGSGCNDSVPTPVPQPTAEQMAASGLDRHPVAPLAQRVDLVAPAFTDPTTITNPLFPISRLGSVVLNGRVDDEPFRTETTLLPETRVIEWSPGQCVKTLVSQYVAYLDGRIQEVALDFYAQAADGSVWYFGEDVFNYERGVIADTGGTWLAGKEGPAAMIMPAAPRPGDTNRPENIPGLVWEEVTVKATDVTVDGPRGPVPGAMVGRELHDDGSFSDKVFAPGYGEFHTADDGDIEALALALPTDALTGSPPSPLQALTDNAWKARKAAAEGDYRRASAAASAARRAWRAHQMGEVPPRLVKPTERALDGLAAAIDDRKRARAQHAAIDLALAALDLRLQYQPIAEIDRARFDLWARQARLDASTRNLAGLLGDVATLEWIRDRIAHTIDAVSRTRLDTALERLRSEVSDRELGAARKTAAAVRALLREAGPAGSV